MLESAREVVKTVDLLVGPKAEYIVENQKRMAAHFLELSAELPDLMEDHLYDAYTEDELRKIFLNED